MSYSLRSGLSFCRPQGRTIFLDVHANRYFELTAPLAAALDRLVAADAPAAARTLAQAGLLVETSSDAPPIAPFAWPVADYSLLEDDRSARTLPHDLPSVALALTKSALALRSQPFQRILENLSRRRMRLLYAEDPRVLALTDRFLATRRLLPLAPICLRDSLALLEFLAFHGRAADLVIGVEAAPFSAHCWVQSGACVLNETVHQARRHTPILAV